MLNHSGSVIPNFFANYRSHDAKKCSLRERRNFHFLTIYKKKISKQFKHIINKFNQCSNSNKAYVKDIHKRQFVVHDSIPYVSVFIFLV